MFSFLSLVELWSPLVAWVIYNLTPIPRLPLNDRMTIISFRARCRVKLGRCGLYQSSQTQINMQITGGNSYFMTTCTHKFVPQRVITPSHVVNLARWSPLSFLIAMVTVPCLEPVNIIMEKLHGVESHPTEAMHFFSNIKATERRSLMTWTAKTFMLSLGSFFFLKMGVLLIQQFNLAHAWLRIWI